MACDLFVNNKETCSFCLMLTFNRIIKLCFESFVQFGTYKQSCGANWPFPTLDSINTCQNSPNTWRGTRVSFSVRDTTRWRRKPNIHKYKLTRVTNPYSMNTGWISQVWRVCYTMVIQCETTVLPFHLQYLL